MGRITLESNALNNYYYLPEMCIELALPLLDFEKVIHIRPYKTLLLIINHYNQIMRDLSIL